jgi:hypothetical protein
MSINVALDEGCDLPFGALPCTIDQASAATHVFLYALDVQLYARTAELLLQVNPDLRVYRPTTTAPFARRRVEEIGFIDARATPHIEPVGPFTRAPPADASKIRLYFSTSPEDQPKKLGDDLLAWCTEQRNALYDQNVVHVNLLIDQLKDVDAKRVKLAERFLNLSEADIKYGKRLGEQRETLAEAIRNGKEMSGLELFQNAVNSFYGPQLKRKEAPKKEEKKKRKDR